MPKYSMTCVLNSIPLAKPFNHGQPHGRELRGLWCKADREQHHPGLGQLSNLMIPDKNPTPPSV
jgi:hypothetical protein